MKITIDIPGAGQPATMNIDGRELTVAIESHGATLLGVKEPETETTVGGIVASQLFSTVNDISRAIDMAAHFDVEGSWTKMSRGVAEDISDRCFI